MALEKQAGYPLGTSKGPEKQAAFLSRYLTGGVVARIVAQGHPQHVFLSDEHSKLCIAQGRAQDTSPRRCDVIAFSNEFRTLLLRSFPGVVLVLLGITNNQGPIMGPTKYLIATYAGPQYIH